MAEYLRMWWAPRFEGPTRSDRMGGWYHPYSPDLLAGWDPLIPGSLAASVSQAEEAVRDLNRSDVRHPGFGRYGPVPAASRVGGLVGHRGPQGLVPGVC